MSYPLAYTSVAAPRIGELVLIADLGTQIFFRPQGIPKDFLHAGHGFDNKNPEMYAIFKAVGPDFQPGRKVSKPIPNITLYPLVCPYPRPPAWRT